MLYLRQDVNEIKQIITSGNSITSNDKPANSALFLPTSNDENNKNLNKGPFFNVEDASISGLKEEAVGEMTMDELEKEAIEKYLRKFKNNRKKTAKALNISERTLYRKIKEYNV